MTLVELQIERAAFADTLGAMRDWLDRHDAGAVKFETAANTQGGIRIRVEFTRADLAQQFAARFAPVAATPTPSAPAGVG